MLLHEQTIISGFLCLSGVYVCVEVDGYEFYDKQAKTHSSVLSVRPHWDQVGLLMTAAFPDTMATL